jgi:hypothetical protein
MDSTSQDNKQWFQPNVAYKGYGRAEFTNPRGYIEGPVEVQFEEHGKYRIELLEIEEFQNEEATDSLSKSADLNHLVTGIKPTRLGDMIMSIGGEFRNTCVRLEVRIDEPAGVFSTTTISSYLQPILGRRSISFYFSHATFEVAKAEKAAFWVLPLTNFLFDFTGTRRGGPQHPLRQHEDSNWIAFEYAGSLGFIEPLDKYDELAHRLRAGKSRSVTTALMVGAVSEQTDNGEATIDWPPFEFFPTLLSLASGNEVSARWAELRGQQGELIKRTHVSWGNRQFGNGRPALRGLHAGGIEHLLTRSQDSKYFGSRELRIAIQRLVKSGLNAANLTLEDQFSFLFRAYEGLPHGLTIPGTKELLTRENYRLLTKIIEDSQYAIENLAQQINIDEYASDNEKSVRRLEKERLERISRRMRIPLNVHMSFGEIVVRLAEKYGLADPAVMAKYYGDCEWEGKLTGAYRAHIMHGNFFDFSREQFQIRDVGVVLYHLQDLLIRVILKMLDYEGHYSPKIFSASIDQPVDWVKENMTAGKLGYESG